MYKGTKGIKEKAIPVQAPEEPPIGSAVNIWFPLDMKTVKLVRDKICQAIWTEAKESDKERMLDIIFAILRSIDPTTMHILRYKTPREIEDLVEEYVDKMKGVKRDNMDCPIPKKQMEIKTRYYEEMFKYRSFIQNYQWDYGDMDEDAGLFIKLREKYKLYNKDYAFTNDKRIGNPCSVCNHTCVFAPRTMCSYCIDFDRIEMFIKISKCFHVMGSYFLFYWYLSEVSVRYLFENWNTLSIIFSRTLNCSPIELYINHEQLKELLQKNDPFNGDSESEIPPTEDKMYKLIVDFNNEQEREKKEEKEARAKLYKKKLDEYKKEKAKKEREKSLQKALYAKEMKEREKKKKDLIKLMEMKKMTEDPLFKKSIEEMGDKELK